MKKISFLVAFMAFFASEINAQIQRVRIDFETPLGYTRQLLLGFTPDNVASDDFDYGYDGACIDNFPDDFSYMIDGERFVIQGVGAFDISKSYPVGVFLTNSGDINISLNSTENFDDPIDVFIYDSLNDTYTLISETSFQDSMDSGESDDRFFVAFRDENQFNGQLSLEDNIISHFELKYSRSTHDLVLKSSNNEIIESLEIYSVLGEKIYNTPNTQGQIMRTKVPTFHSGISLLKIKSNRGITYKKVLL